MQRSNPHPSRTSSPIAPVTSFFDIWFVDGPLYGAIHGPRLAENNKPDWNSLRSHWKASRKRLETDWADVDYFAGKRFNSKTSYWMLDIDYGSRYHPSEDRAAYHHLMAVLKEIGLVQPVVTRSSDSIGLNNFFPLGEQVKTWTNAKKIFDYLISKGITIKDGILELFPHPKAKDSQYKGHRLPLQLGSYLLNDSFEPWSNDLTDFLNAWNVAAQANQLDFRGAFRTNTHSATATGKQDSAMRPSRQLPPLAWTGPRQSNEIMRALANWGYEKEGFKTVPELAQWMKMVAPQLPGYSEFTSNTTKRDIQGNWCTRWARSRVRRAGGKAQSQFNLNEERADAATARLQAVLPDLAGKIWPSANRLYQAVQEKILEKFGISTSKGTFQARKVLWESLLTAWGGPNPTKKELLDQEDLEKQPLTAKIPPSQVHDTPSTVDNQKRPDNPDIQAFEDCPNGQPEPTSDKKKSGVVEIKSSPRESSEGLQKIGRVTKAQLVGLPNPKIIRVTGGELKAAGIDGYDQRFEWTIHQPRTSPIYGDWPSDDLWNRLRFVAHLAGKLEPS